mmetsp:Transcript_6764/g.18475  ORF Transcript_6764/g.18475 Transcript_6764/m.18475 type:complete len:230 (-) Transcript_6764:54-743(-)
MRRAGRSGASVVSCVGLLRQGHALLRVGGDRLLHRDPDAPAGKRGSGTTPVLDALASAFVGLVGGLLLRRRLLGLQLLSHVLSRQLGNKVDAHSNGPEEGGPRDAHGDPQLRLPLGEQLGRQAEGFPPCRMQTSWSRDQEALRSLREAEGSSALRRGMPGNAVPWAQPQCGEAWATCQEIVVSLVAPRARGVRRERLVGGLVTQERRSMVNGPIRVVRCERRCRCRRGG